MIPILCYVFIGLVLWCIDTTLCLRDHDRPSLVWIGWSNLRDQSAEGITEWVILGLPLSMFWPLLLLINAALSIVIGIERFIEHHLQG